MMEGIEFAHPGFFLIGIALPVILLAYGIFYRSWFGWLKISSLRGFTGGRSMRELLRHSLILFRIGALALLITAMARPQSSLSWQDVSTEGIDIVIAMDISGSMLARDLKPNRLEASKDVAIEFIDGRPNDRIGLVIYSGEAFSQCPLTTDHSVVRNLFEEIENGMIEDGTAIGLGLATAVNRLKAIGLWMVTTTVQRSRTHLVPQLAPKTARKPRVAIVYYLARDPEEQDNVRKKTRARLSQRSTPPSQLPQVPSAHTWSTYLHK